MRNGDSEKIMKAYLSHCAKLQEQGRYRLLTPAGATEEGLLDFTTNDYLGLSSHPALLSAAVAAAERYGVGATGARLLSGNYSIYESFEERIASDKKTTTALIFNTGFQANVAVLASLLDQRVLGQQPIVFFDRNNHASLYQAVQLCGALLVRYRHNDMQHLAALMQQFAQDRRPKFMVTETIFSMDGDCWQSAAYLALARQYEAWVYLDEAHATGLFGPRGYGLSTVGDWQDISYVVMGTFSKALGCSGAYVACSQAVKDYLINKAPGFMYTTAMSPLVLGAAQAAWQLMPTYTKEREQLLQQATALATKLRTMGFTVGQTASPIVPILLGSSEAALTAQQQLLAQGIKVAAIRSPTVALGTERLRVTLRSTHSQKEIQRLIDACQQLLL